MDLKQFKQLGLKSGDRVECIIDREKCVGIVRHTLENQYEYESWKLDTDDSRLRLLCVPRTKRVFPTSIKKLPVTKKKEKKGEKFIFQGNAKYVKGLEPTVKSLSNLEVGDVIKNGDETLIVSGYGVQVKPYPNAVPFYKSIEELERANFKLVSTNVIEFAKNVLQSEGYYIHLDKEEQSKQEKREPSKTNPYNLSSIYS